MRNLKRIKVRGIWIPNYVIWIKGFIHGKRKIVSLDGEENKKLRSPYLYERRYAYAEYREKLTREAETQMIPLRKEISSVAVKVSVAQEKLNVVKNKLDFLKNPVTGNERRAKIKLEKSKEQLELAIAEEKSQIEEIQENIKLIGLLTSHLLEQNLSREQAKAYVYVTGIQRSLKDKNYYLKADDYAKEVFQDLIPANS